MIEEILSIGFESSNRIGKLIFQSGSLRIELSDEEIIVPLISKGRKDYFYLDYIENTISIFKIVCHIVKSDGVETDVICSFFIKDEIDLEQLKSFINQLKPQQHKETTENKKYQSIQTIRIDIRKGWLSKRRNGL